MMNTRDEAVSYLLGEGVYAAKRDWLLGETIVVASGISVVDSGITAFERCVYIIPEGHGWKVIRLGPVPGALPKSLAKLKDACEAALELLIK